MADESFDSYVPLTAMEDAKSSVVSQLAGGAVASVVDLGTSIYNSLTPDSMSVDTRDMIARVSDNAVKVYDEHPDAVHAASFIGGVFLPVGFALKGVQAARAGMKGVNWFSEAGKIDQMAKVNNLIKEGKMLSDEYNIATRSLYLRNAANVVVDNAAAELAIVTTLNAHPLMEDYIKDPIHNFSVGMLIGTAIGGPLGHIAARGDIRKLGAEAYTEAMTVLNKDIKAIDQTADYSLQIAQYKTNIDNWKNFNDVAGASGEYNALTKNLASAFARHAEAEQIKIFEKMASEEINALPVELRDNIISAIANQPERFAGINALKFATAKEEASFLSSKFNALVENTESATGIPLTKLTSKGEIAKDDMVYSPTFDAFFRRTDMKGFGVASDLVQTEKDLTKNLSSNWHMTPNYDADMEKLVQTSAFLDADYLRKLKAVDEMSVERLSQVAIHPEDGAMLNAVMARLEKMRDAGEDISAFKVTLTANKPNWDVIEKQLWDKEVQRITTGGEAGVKPTYMDDLTRNVEQKWDNFDLFSNNISSRAVSILRGWKAGSGMTHMRKAIDDAFRPSQYARHGVPEADLNAVKEIYNSKASKALRDSLMSVADAEGYVYLYRGLRREGFSSATLESFTTNAAKAAEFGTPKLYKVKVQDVFGGIRDIPGRAGYNRSTEVLVLAHTREGIEKLPIAELKDALPAAFKNLSHFNVDEASFSSSNKISMKNLVANSYDDFAQTNPLNSFLQQEANKGIPTAELTAQWEAQAQQFVKTQLDDYVKELNAFNSTVKANSTLSNSAAGYTELSQALLNTKTKDIDMMLALDMPLEVIRTRTNTPIEVLQAYVAGKSTNLKLEDIPGYRMYNAASEVGQHLSVEKRSLQLGTTADKIPVAQMRSKIHISLMDEADTLIKQTMLSASESASLKELANFLFTKDNMARKSMLKDALALINTGTMGSKFWSSTDFALRDMGVAGLILTEIGKESSHLYNKFTNQIVKPISNAFAEIVKDPAGVVEFNLARNMNASIKGYREFRVTMEGEKRVGQFFVQDTAVPTILREGVEERNMIPAKFQGAEYKITTDSVITAFEQMGLAGREMYAMNSTYRKILGQSKLNDMGFWMPALNPRDKYITYVIDDVTQNTMLLYGRTPAELKSAEDAYVSQMKDRTPGTWRFVRKGEDQAAYNKIEGRHDPMFMSVADATSLHSGSSTLAITPTNASAFSELANGYEHYIHRSIANHLELQYDDVLQQLDRVSFEAQTLTKNQPVGNLQKALNIPTDAGLTAKNTLLGRSNLKEYVGWQDAQNAIQSSTEHILQSITKIMDPLLNPVKGVFGKGKVASDADWEKLIVDMEERGIPNPYMHMDAAIAKERFNVERLSQAPNMTARLVALSNNLAATTLLKVMELGQPIVNMLSLPVLTSAAVQRQFAQNFMGAELAPNFHLSTTRAMYDGMRFLAHPEYTKYKNKAAELGVLTPVLSEVSDLLQMARSFNPGVMQKVENALNSKVVDFLSKPAMKSEEIVREVAFATGVSLAKKAYPGLGDAGVMTFARNFVDTAVGNYNPAQRPTLFQGTIGTAMGLFQTYMVTLGQQIYKKAEVRDYKNLMKMALTQSSIFGVKSLPGFNQVSEAIGEHFSEEHYDLTTGMYKAVSDPVADLVLYGLPSNLGPSVYSRGDIQPRIPNIAGGLQNLAAVNILGQAFQTAGSLAGAVKQMGDEGGSMAFMEALSVQSISRPVARLSEFVTGHSVTRKGNEIAGPEEIYSAQGIFARVLATRGIREAKAREAQYLDSVYKGIDRDRRTEASAMLKNHIRSGTLTPDVQENIMEKYMRTGSPTGWRAVVNTALQDTDSPGVSAVRNHLSPKSPANLMIEDLD